MATIGLRRSGACEYMTLRPFTSGGEVGRVALSSVWNAWVSIDMTFAIGDNGALWTRFDGDGIRGGGACAAGIGG